jgi:hypothetical protein
MNYRIIKPQSKHAAQLLQDTLDWLASEETMQNDYQKLALACCAPDAPVTITRAPKPHILLKTDMITQPKEEMETFLL